jgi:hypothetical protein
MANTNRPFGLMPVQGGGASAFAFQVGRYYIPSSDNNAYYIGSPVKLLAGADAVGIPGVVVAAGTDTLVGSVVGVESVSVNTQSMVGVNINYEQVSIPATKTRPYYVYVADDPNQVFLCQGDATSTNQVAANANKNASLTIAAPSPATLPQSATVIASSTIATNNTLNIALLGLAQQPNNAFGAYAVWRCKINLHQYANGRTGV